LLKKSNFLTFFSAGIKKKIGLEFKKIGLELIFFLLKISFLSLVFFGLKKGYFLTLFRLELK